MTRDVDAAILGTLTDSTIYPFFAVELLFDGANVIRLWTGTGTLSYEGNDWVGSGELLTVSAIEETSEIAVRGATLKLSGIPSEILSLALSEPYQGRECNIYFGTFDAGTPTLVQIFTGYMDLMDIEENAETCNIELSAENRLIDLERARVARFTSGYQKSVYPGDLGLDFVESLQDRPISWGKATT